MSEIVKNTFDDIIFDDDDCDDLPLSGRFVDCALVPTALLAVTAIAALVGSAAAYATLLIWIEIGRLVSAQL